MFKKLIHIINDLIFPIHCVGCKRPGEYLCLPCETSLPTLNPRLTEIIQKNIWGLFNYEDPAIRQLIWHLKYHGISDISRYFSQQLYYHLINIIGDDPELESYIQSNKIVLITPPSHTKGGRKRDHMELVARKLESLGNFLAYDPKIISLARPTKTQVECKTRPERLANVAGAFAVNEPEKISNKICLVIDDVFTTGATVNELRKILLQNGALRVMIITVAHGRKT